MSLKSRTKKPPCGWVYRQPETAWDVRKSTSGKLIQAIYDHRIENKLKRVSLEEIWEDVETHICNVLKGTWALWDFCNVKMPRPQRASTRPQTAQAVNPFPVRGQRTTPKAEQIKADIETRKAANAKAKKEGRPAKRPCKTCGGSSSTQNGS